MIELYEARASWDDTARSVSCRSGDPFGLRDCLLLHCRQSQGSLTVILSGTTKSMGGCGRSGRWADREGRWARPRRVSAPLVRKLALAP